MLQLGKCLFTEKVLSIEVSTTTFANENNLSLIG
jgi:hypothetical protein